MGVIKLVLDFHKITRKKTKKIIIELIEYLNVNRQRIQSLEDLGVIKKIS